MQFKFVGDLRQVGGFLQVFRFPSTNKTDHHDITEILLKVVLNTMNQTIQMFVVSFFLITRYLCIHLFWIYTNI
jgi:hypothetical protein